MKLFYALTDMPYLLTWMDGKVIRWINRLILLHLAICVGAIGGLGMSLISSWEFVGALRLPSVLMSQAESIEVPLVLRERERWHAPSSSWLCYLAAGDLAVPYLRKENPAPFQSLKIYQHPQLGRNLDGSMKVVEVPRDPDWNSVFEAAEGRSLFSASARLAGIWLLTLLSAYIAIRGYWLIKRGRRRSQTTSR